MAQSVLMAVEGVLAGESHADRASLLTADSLDAGIVLFHALRSAFHLVLSSLETNDDLVRQWLQARGISRNDYARLLVADTERDATMQRCAHLVAAQGMGYSVAFVVDPDPLVAREALRRGITPLLCPHPVYARYSFLPSSREGGLAWQEIEYEVSGQRQLRAADTRTEVDDIPEEALYDRDL